MVTKKIIPLFFLLFGLQVALYAQSDSITISEAWLSKLTMYRDQVLSQDSAAVEELRLLLGKWNGIGASEQEQFDFAFNVFIARTIQGWSYKLIKKKAEEYTPGVITDMFTEVELQVIERNADVFDLLFLGVLKWEYPFALKLDAEILRELSVYELTAGERIGEIGAGTGMLSMTLRLLEPGAAFYVNELDRDFIDYMQAKLQRNEEEALTDGLELIKGSRRSTEMEGFDLDKIIVRNTLHHFKQPEEMLASIKQSLSAEGVLFVWESIRELDHDGDGCTLAMSRSEVTEVLFRAGFTLEVAWEFEEGILLKLTAN